MDINITDAVGALREAIRIGGQNLVEREQLVELVVLSAVASEHMLVVGAPGTAKSEAVRRISATLGGRYFEYLLGRFTEPSEIFGPVDLRRLREGVLETETAGMLPEADIAFLDEVFRGSTAILNTLLGILNERRFRRGHTDVSCPLMVCVGATNELPEDPSLQAFADRFLVHVFVEPVADPLLEDLLESGWRLTGALPRVASIDALKTVAKAVTGVDLSAVRSTLAHGVRILRREDIHLTDRRVVKVQRLIAAATLLGGRQVAAPADLWPLLYAIPTADEQQRGRNALRDLLNESSSSALTHAAESASSGLLAKAELLVREATALLEQPLAEPTDRARLEGILRDIDAGFMTESRPLELTETRERIAALLESDVAETSSAALDTEP